NEDGYLLGDWQTCWFIFAAYALVVGVLFALVFRQKKENEELSKIEK
ncbi:MAG: MFS transporter, partial [Prevotella sp.]|nr:MFS transporter [Prevotella sp.]